MFTFTLKHEAANCAARRGTLTFRRGTVQTPTFMPVGTLGTVKGIEVNMLRESGAEMVLGNTYHLAIRPGEQTVAALGGLHKFMGWSGPILTDSGGFQIYSLAKIAKIDEQGARFRSHVDGRLLELTPERSIEIQTILGSDVAMVLDHVCGLPATRKSIEEAMFRSIRWAKRSQIAAKPTNQTVFAIVQGGLEKDLRRICAEELSALDFPGYAIGGLSVGESAEDMYETIEATVPYLPREKPRYLMGVGKPSDILNGILRGIDMFDCVMPTRNGRNAMGFSDQGPIRIRNAKYERDPRPLEEDCPCPACKHSRGYIRHLFQAKEMLGPLLLTIHNLTYYQRLVLRARAAIERDEFPAFFQSRMQGWAE